MQEVYTRTFDLQPACYPYLGHHLFAEDNRRGLFMAGLMRHYRFYDFSSGKELPDHVAVILRFLARCPGAKENDELVRECLVPALEKMLSGLNDPGNPYSRILQALMTTLPTGSQISD
jgi:nitrate reductase delta subunit